MNLPTLIESIAESLAVDDPPETVEHIYALYPDYDAIDVRSALTALVVAGRLWWNRPTGDLALIREARPEVGVTD